MQRIIVVLTLVVFSTPASAIFYSGNQMVAHCSSNRSLVVGYVAGAFDKSQRARDAYLRYGIDMVAMADLKKPEDPEQRESFFPANQLYGLLRTGWHYFGASNGYFLPISDCKSCAATGCSYSLQSSPD